MSWGSRRVLFRFVLFGLMGLLFEVLTGSVMKAWKGDWNLHGATSPWMILDYGLFAVLLMPAAEWLKRRRVPLAGRAFAYMLLIYAVEYASGHLFTVCGLRIWNYRWLTYHFQEQIALEFAPVWYAMGLAAEFLYGRVDACAVVLALGVKADEIKKLRRL